MDGPIRSISKEAMRALVGREVGVSEWVRIDQAMIDAFADLTGDHAMIHVDPKRAAATQFGGTIAHGFLTMSLLSKMIYQACPGIEGARYAVNYGFNRLRFVAPTPCGARVRGRFRLIGFEEPSAGRLQSTYEVAVEIEGDARPALAAEWLSVAFE